MKAAVAALEHTYSHIITAQSQQSDGGGIPWLLQPSSSEDSSNDGDGDGNDVLQQYYCWMRDTYYSMRDQLLCLLLHPNHTLAVG